MCNSRTKRVVAAEPLGHARLDTTLPIHADLEDAGSYLPTDQ